MEVDGASCRRSPGVRVIPHRRRRRCPGGGDFPVDFVIASTAEPQQLAEFAEQLVQKAFASGHVHVRRHRPEVRSAAGRGGLRPRQAALAGGRPAARPAAISRRCSAANYVNRFSIQGRSYKVIPQVKRSERLTPDQLEQIYVTGAAATLVPLSTFATLQTTTEPRELKRFQQLNAVRIQGVIPPPVLARPGADVPRGRGAEDPAAGLHDRLRRRVAPAAHRGRQVPRHVPALGDPDLSGAGGAVRELPRSVHHPGRLGAAGALRARCSSRSSASRRSTSTARSD